MRRPKKKASGAAARADAAAKEPLYIIAPIVSMFTALAAFSVLPFGAGWNLWGHHINGAVVNVPISLILIFALGSLGIYGFIIGGWASESKYSILGSMRTCAQLVSYEVSLALSVLGLGNLYYEKLTRPEPVASSPVTAMLPPAVSAPAPAAATTPAPTPAPPPQQQAVSVPPQNPDAIPAVTPRPAPALPTAATSTPAPQPPPRFAADFAIERGWLAAQPYAVDPRLARRVGSSQPYPTLKSIVCGRTPNCTSDALLAAGMEDEQLIALQMLMSQIGDRFCVPRRSLAVTGVASAAGLADLAAIAKCAGGAPAACKETQNRVCAPDADALQSGSRVARAALLRWALWKTGSI